MNGSIAYLHPTTEAERQANRAALAASEAEIATLEAALAATGDPEDGTTETGLRLITARARAAVLRETLVESAETYPLVVRHLLDTFPALTQVYSPAEIAQRAADYGIVRRKTLDEPLAGQ